MNPLRLQASGYRTFADPLDLAFPEGAVAVVGPNGAGKSSIVNAIDLALFGGRLADHLTDDGSTEELQLELEFEHAGQRFRVRRSFSARTKAGKSTCDFEVCDADGAWVPLTGASIRDTDALIVDTLAFSRETWRASSFLSQGDGGFFAEMDPRDRKRVLGEAIFGRDPVWPRLQEAVRVDKRAAETRMSGIQGALERAEAELAALPEVRARAAAADEQARARTLTLAAAETALQAVLDNYRAVEALAGERREAFAAVVEARAALQSLDHAETTARDAAEGLPEVTGRVQELMRLVAKGVELEQQNRLRQLEHADWQRAKEYQARREEEEATARKLAEEARAKAVHIRDHIGEAQACDRCGQTLGAEAAGRAIDSYLAEAARLDEEALAARKLAAGTTVGEEPAGPDEIPAEIRNAPSELGAARERKAQLEQRVAAAAGDDFVARITLARATLAGHEQRLAALPPADVTEIDRIKTEGLQARAKVNEARQAKDDAAADAVRAKADLDRLDQLQERTAADQAERDSLHRELAILARLEKAYGANGIPALILENVAIPAIEAEANRVIGLLGGKTADARIELHTQREQKTTETLRETLDIVVTTADGSRREYENWSGGEKARINLALRLGLASLLAGRRGAESRLFVIDEPEGLDAAGKQALVEILRGSLMRGISRAYLISHDAELRDAFDVVLEVVDMGGRSRVVGAEAPELVAA